MRGTTHISVLQNVLQLAPLQLPARIFRSRHRCSSDRRRPFHTFPSSPWNELIMLRSQVRFLRAPPVNVLVRLHRERGRCSSPRPGRRQATLHRSHLQVVASSDGERPRGEGGRLVATGSQREPTPSTRSRSFRWSSAMPAVLEGYWTSVAGRPGRPAPGRVRGLEVVGLHLTWSQIRRAYDRGGLSGYLRAAAHQLPCRDAEFDTVVLCLAIEHVEPFEAAIRGSRPGTDAGRPVPVPSGPSVFAITRKRVGGGCRFRRALLASRLLPR